MPLPHKCCSFSILEEYLLVVTFLVLVVSFFHNFADVTPLSILIASMTLSIAQLLSIETITSAIKITFCCKYTAKFQIFQENWTKYSYKSNYLIDYFYQLDSFNV